MRNWHGPEQTKYCVNLQIQKARVHKRPFWKNIYSGDRAPPVDPDRFMDWLRDICYRKEVRLPAVLCVFRNHCEGEDRRFHYIVKVSLSDEGYHILKAYAGDRGVPHSKRDQDYPWKYGSLPDNRLDIRRCVPMDPASRIPAPNLKIDLTPPAFNIPHPPKLSRSFDAAADIPPPRWNKPLPPVF